MLLAATFQVFTKCWALFSRLGCSLLLVILVLYFLLLISSVRASELPCGVYSLTPSGKSVNATVLMNQAVRGISIREQWQDVEQSEGVYDWSYFDTQITRISSASKNILLRVVAGGDNTPQWVFDAGVQTFSFVDTNRYHDTYNQTVTIPVFWDKIFLQKKKKFLKAVGGHFAADPNIVLVSTSCANALSDDWNVPSTPEDVQNWQAIGYTSDKLINACKEIMDTTMAAFPGKLVLLAVGQNGRNLDSDPDYVARQVVQYGRTMYPGRLIVQKNSLSADTPNPLVLPILGAWQIIFDNRPYVAGQMLWSATDDSRCRLNGGAKPCDPETVLQEVVWLGAQYGMCYEEIYQKDILNPDLAGVISYASDLLAPR
jgi:hypothetical protein